MNERLSVTVSSPYQTFLQDSLCDQVNLCTTTGEIGILHKHVPTIQELKPGLIEVMGCENGPLKFFGKIQF
jgi:F-type H+-transporting ATPase subunit delta